MHRNRILRKYFIENDNPKMSIITSPDFVSYCNKTTKWLDVWDEVTGRENNALHKCEEARANTASLTKVIPSKEYITVPKNRGSSCQSAIYRLSWIGGKSWHIMYIVAT